MSEKSEKNDERDDAIPYCGTPYVEFTGYAFEGFGRLVFECAVLQQDVVPPGGRVRVVLLLDDEFISSSPPLRFDQLTLVIYPADE